MRVSLKEFTRDPYKYAKKAPVLIILGDYPRYVLIHYKDYKEKFLNNQQDPVAPVRILQSDEPKKKHWLKRLLF